MKKIVVVGVSGSGKSYFAARLGEKLGLPVHHLDRLFWNPGWQQPEKDPFHNKILKLTEEDAWVVDGNYSRTLKERIKKSDAVFFLDLNKWHCRWNVLKRYWKHRGQTRPDMADGCAERFNWGFLKGNFQSYPHNRPKLISALREAGNEKNIVIFRTQEEVNDFLNKL